MIRKFTYLLLSILASALLLVACSGHSNDSRLVQADTLLSQHKDKEVLSLLSSIDKASFNKADNAYYCLLLTKAQYRNHVFVPGDSVIDIAVEYFRENNDSVRYTRALIAKGEMNDALGNQDIAVDCFHMAEDVAASTDYNNLGYAKLRLGFVYQNEYLGVKSIAMEKYREALPLFRKASNKYNEMLCLSHMGHLMRAIEDKGDSAVLCLNEAIKIAQELNEKGVASECKYSLAEYYSLMTNDYGKAKAIGIEAINSKDFELEHPRLHYCIAQIYAHEGQVDSAWHYVNTAPKMIESVDTMWYYKTLADIAKHSKQIELSQRYLNESNKISASMLIIGLNYKLLSVEKKYDTQKVELKNQALQAKFQNSLLIIALCVIIVLVLIVFVIRYRSRYRLKQSEFESMTADLNASLRSLEDLKNTLKEHEEKKQLSSRMDGEDNNAVNGMKSIIDDQIKMVHQLILWSYEYDEKKFAEKFQSIMSLSEDGNSSSYWRNIQTIANDLHNNILVKAQELASGKLNESEINFLALYSCGISRTVIMLCMKYKSLGTIYNKKIQIAKKLKVNNLDEFITGFTHIGEEQ